MTGEGEGAALTSPRVLDPGQMATADARSFVVETYRTVRNLSRVLSEPLTPEDQTAQSMPCTSPTKWHLAHTTWFFETFLLKPFVSGYAVFDRHFAYLFNSYYEAEGPRHARPRRGLLTRPSLADVLGYRDHVDAACETLIATADEDRWQRLRPLLELGLHHEQQHQELILTDIKHLFSLNPLCPAYAPHRAGDAESAAELGWQSFDEGLYEIGHTGPDFAFDCESPRHTRYLNGFRIASRPVTNGEYLAFIEDGGYRNPMLWLSDGWAMVAREGWQAPLYWTFEDGAWQVYGLTGTHALDLDEPVSHVSYFEADAFASWAGKRLPGEDEWEIAAATVPVAGNFLDGGCLRPRPAKEQAEDGTALLQVYGDVWEWTRSAFVPYPGFRRAEGAVGEYNGKFMSGQMVLRGGSCLTPPGHLRPTYRNFFYPGDRWQVSGIRLAEDV